MTPFLPQPVARLGWVGGAAFEKIVQGGEAAEGELIRYLRMTVQLARALAYAKGVTSRLRARAGELLKRINRDEVDAEAELRRSL